MKEYNIKEVEEKIKKLWEKEKIYSFEKDKKKKNIFSIDTPPPTVSGKMHIGHAFSYSQQDFIARYRRMKQGVFYPFGTDDNGLPTERLIEKINNVKSKNMSRSEFIDLCLKTLNEITPDFVQDWKNLGISADYDICYSTIDKYSQTISQNSFIELYKKGEIYQKEFPTLWCCECQTAIAQAELEDKEQETFFTTLKFSVENKELLIATTRPELLGACVAVFVNPQDKRYKHFVGKKAKVPIFEQEVPVLEDTSAEIEKGTGALMICSYGDKYDVDALQRHKLTPKIVFNKNGTLNDFDERYDGLKIKDARKKILEKLKENNLIFEQKKIYHHVNVHDKCGTEIEFIPTKQWFIKILDKKKQFVEQGRKITWYPEHMRKRYENWIQGLDWDWSISRDRHFGIPLPVWYCQKCKKTIIAEKKELPLDPINTKKICPNCHTQAIPETKVLDTWATSSLTPQLASNLIKNRVTLPYSLRPQAHDIIRTWAFYTIVKAYLHEKKLPWKEIIISGNVSLGGEKMSKSKGNVINPQEILEKYGADALRFWAAGSKLGEDLDYQEKDLITGKKLVNKLWNASNFVFMNLNDYKETKFTKLEKVDEVFLQKLNETIKNSTTFFEKYEYNRAKLEIEQFFWNIFCDYYLEIVKWRVYNGNNTEKESAFYTLYSSLFNILKLLAPIMPFVTEEIYQTHYLKNKKVKSIHNCSWPEEIKIKKSKKNEELFDELIEIIGKVRQEKTKAQKSMKAEIILTLEKEKIKKFKFILNDLKNVVNASNIQEGKFKIEFIN